MNRNYILSVFISLPFFLAAQCGEVTQKVLSPRIANYDIDVVLNTTEKEVVGTEQIVWVNPSPDTISEIRMYMYINAFKNTESTFLKGAGSNIFGQDIHDRKKEEWGYIEVEEVNQNNSVEIGQNQSYVQPDDDNETDETVLSLMLAEPILPFDTLRLALKFTAKLPQLMVRTGYSRDDFYHFTHWFPQMGVYEPNSNGQWDWNCHQFHRRTEFYSDFGNYSVAMEVPDHLIIAGTGCQTSEEPTREGWKKYVYEAEDVIDFAWVAYPYFKEFEDNWNGIDIKLLTPMEHDILAPRFIGALKAALEYLEDHVGPYPYPSITMMDPPIHALSSGFMEYPSYITLGSFRFFPKGVRTIESLVMHEFAHQYFMGVVASNEKEEAWLDEGFVTYYEDRIMEATYGSGRSMIDIYGFNLGSSEFTRYEYSSLPDPSIGPCARVGWEIEGEYKGIIYSKTATVLKTMERLLGMELMDNVIQSYFQKWKFKHPKGKDFINVVKEVVLSSDRPKALGDIDRFFNQLIYGTDVCDYEVVSIENIEKKTASGLFGSKSDLSVRITETEEGLKGDILLRRLGGVILPQEMYVTFGDGTSEMIYWDGSDKQKHFYFDKEVVSCWLDPDRKIMVDMDTNNNSLTLEKNPWPIYKIGVKTVFWLQNLIQSFSFLV